MPGPALLAAAGRDAARISFVAFSAQFAFGVTATDFRKQQVAAAHRRQQQPRHDAYQEQRDHADAAA